jgi:hypothetical protein
VLCLVRSLTSRPFQWPGPPPAFLAAFFAGAFFAALFAGAFFAAFLAGAFLAAFFVATHILRNVFCHTKSVITRFKTQIEPNKPMLGMVTSAAPLQCYWLACVLQFLMDTIAVAGLAVGAIGALAAVAAAWFAWKAPTKEDLERVESNTAKTSERLEKVQSHIASVNERLNDQHSYDLLVSRAQKVSISVNANDRMNDPLNLRFTLNDPLVTLTRIETFNQVGTLFGSADCSLIETLIFSASIEPNMAQRWFSAGTPDQSFNRKLLRLRAHMLIENREVYRDFAVHLVQGSRQGIDRTHMNEQIFILEGNC